MEVQALTAKLYGFKSEVDDVKMMLGRVSSTSAKIKTAYGVIADHRLAILEEEMEMILTAINDQMELLISQAKTTKEKVCRTE